MERVEAGGPQKLNGKCIREARNKGEELPAGGGGWAGRAAGSCLQHLHISHPAGDWRAGPRVKTGVRRGRPEVHAIDRARN